ncbi:MAG: small ribosomal subunit Rsm22 family protein [Planctomycetota bacterium]|nr:small ribosomal subunit Rsm22 family protein [Planctomycetota bacterium]
MTQLDWDRLQRLRDRFLDPDDRRRTIPDYWLESADLEVYDQVLAERIGWKWDAVLAEIAQTDFLDDEVQVAKARVLDWGCGTGIAARRFIQHFGGQQVTLHDRSAAAMDYAEARLRESSSALDIQQQPASPTVPDILLLSHVLGELDQHSETQVIDLLRRCPRVVWVEAGTRPIARRLSAIRDNLLDEFRIAAPCPHQASCPTLREGDQHWCHLFAKPPTRVFMDGRWREIGRRLNIDLRALPYHFLAMVRTDSRTITPSGTSTSRLLGRPEIRNKFVRFYQCEEAGISERTVFKSREANLYKRIKKTGSL